MTLRHSAVHTLLDSHNDLVSLYAWIILGSLNNGESGTNDKEQACLQDVSVKSEDFLSGCIHFRISFKNKKMKNDDQQQRGPNKL